MTDVSIAILAGGSASRMGGSPKGLITVDGQPIIERLIDAATLVSDDIFIVANSMEHYAYLRLPVYQDKVAGKGPLGGLYTALATARHDRVVLIACDMPYITSQAIRKLLAYDADAAAVVPRTADGIQPLFAAYHKSLYESAGEAIEHGRNKMVDFIESVSHVWLSNETFADCDQSDKLWLNLNRIEDLLGAGAELPK